jgi:hypothetical protein
LNHIEGLREKILLKTNENIVEEKEVEDDSKKEFFERLNENIQEDE